MPRNHLIIFVMTKLNWNRAKSFKDGTAFAFDSFAKTGSFADICRSLNLKNDELKDVFENYAAAQSAAEKLKIRSFLWSNLNNLKKINNFFVGVNFLNQPHKFQKECIDSYKSFLISFLNIPGSSDLLNQPEIIIAIRITKIKKGRKVTAAGNGQWIFI